MGPARRALVAGSGLFLLAFAAVALGLTREVDLAFTRWIQQFASPTLDLLAELDTLPGQSTIDAALALILAAALLLRGPRLRAVAPLLIGLVVLVELAGKLLLAHPAPTEEFVRTAANPLGIRFPTPSSFPSGHVSRTTFLAILGAALAGRRSVTVVLAALAIVTPLLRVYIGDHWLSDAVGALGLGVAVGALAVLWLRRVDAG